MQVRDIRISLVNGRNGLVGFVSCLVNESIRIDSIAIHQLANKTGYRIVYPRDKRNRLYYFPINQKLRKQLEDAIFNELRISCDGYCKA